MLEINWSDAMGNPVVLADYIEMAISLDEEHPGLEFTYANFVDYLQDVPFSRNNERFSDDDDVDEVQPYDERFLEGDDVDEVQPYDEGFLEGDDMDEAQPYFEDAVALIDRRRQWLGDLYPFSVQGSDVILSAQSERTIWTPYVFLLACSHHRLITRKSPRLETEFEKICKEAMKSLCNAGANVFLFSRNSADRTDLGGSAHEAVRNLASMLNTVVLNENELPKTQREFGIDIIAIDRVEDGLGYPLLMTAQCTVADNPEVWGRKKTEPQLRGSLGHFLHYDAPYIEVFFIPHLPRSKAHSWSVPPYLLNGCIVCDRYRICKLLQRHQEAPDSWAAQSIEKIVGDFIDRDGDKIAEGNLDSFSYLEE